jgi:type II secretory pathway pseudopilin PulG
MEKNFLKGFLILELLITIGLVSMILVFAVQWLSMTNKLSNKVHDYYVQRELLINRAERLDGSLFPVTKNIVLVTVTANGEVLQFLH